METMTYEEITEQLKDVFGSDWYDDFTFYERVAAVAYATLNQTTDKEKVYDFAKYRIPDCYEECLSIEEVAEQYLEDAEAFDYIDRKYVDIAWFAADWSSDRNYIEIEYGDKDAFFKGFVVWK